MKTTWIKYLGFLSSVFLAFFMKKDCLLCFVSSPFSPHIERFDTMNCLNKSLINRAAMPLSLRY